MSSHQDCRKVMLFIKTDGTTQKGVTFRKLKNLIRFRITLSGEHLEGVVTLGFSDEKNICDIILSQELNSHRYSVFFISFIYSGPALPALDQTGDFKYKLDSDFLPTKSQLKS